MISERNSSLKDIDLISIKTHWLKYFLKHRVSKKIRKKPNLGKNFCSFSSSHKNIPNRNRPVFFPLISLSCFRLEQSSFFFCSRCEEAEPTPTWACLGFYSIPVHVIAGGWKQETVSSGKSMALGGTKAWWGRESIGHCWLWSMVSIFARKSPSFCMLLVLILLLLLFIFLSSSLFPVNCSYLNPQPLPFVFYRSRGEKPHVVFFLVEY